VRAEARPGDTVVVKIGSTSLVGPSGEPEHERLKTLVDGLADLVAEGVRVILVSSGAIAAGLHPLGLGARPSDIPSLQAAAAVGQGRLFNSYAGLLADRGLTAAQVLLTRYDFMHRQQYLNARNTLERLLSLGAVPIVNENDTIAVDEIRFGDNDRLAALVANLTGARLLLLLTDAKGLHTADPRKEPDSPLIDEVETITPELERIAGGRGSELSSGGMASKLAAAWVATFSGVGVVVAGAFEPNVLGRAASGEAVGTYFHPHPRRVSARRLWIAFAQPPKGTVVVDDGAKRAVARNNRSLLAVGVVDVRGTFQPGDTVDIATGDREVFARGLIRFSSDDLKSAKGRRSGDLAGGEVIHRDHLIVLEEPTDA
jgi:glutamate 5-kinase